MATRGDKPLKNPKHEAYALARCQGVVPREAYRLAGYSGEASSAPYKLESDRRIKARVMMIQQRAAKQTVNSLGVTRAEIVESIRLTRGMAIDGMPVFNRDGEPTGSNRPDLNSANKSNELLAKMHGFLLDVVKQEDFDAELEGMTDQDIAEFTLSLLQQLDPNMRKKLVAELTDEVKVIDIEASEPGTETLQ